MEPKSKGIYPLYAAYSIYRHLLPKKEEDMPVSELYAIWNRVLENNIYVLCKTKMAQDITRRTLTGFTKATVNTHYQPHLLDRMKADMDWVVKKLKNPAVWGKEGASMKFDAIVGNPPYQGTNHSQVYPFFYLSAIKTTHKYVSLIFPTGWQQPKTANNLGILNTPEIKSDRQIVYIDNRQNVFPNIAGAEWVNIVLWQKDYDNGLDGQQLVYTEGKSPMEVQLVCETENINKPEEIIRLAEMVATHDGFTSLQEMTSLSKPYGLRKDAFNRLDYYNLAEMFIEKHCETDIKIYGSNGVIRYVPFDYVLPKKTIAFAKYKVLVGSAWGNMSESAGLGGAFANIIIAKPYEICTETYQESGVFDNFETAQKHAKYLMTKFARALLYVNKMSQMSTRAWGAVPVQDYGEPWWDKSIAEIDKELIKKYNIPQDIADFIDKNIQTKTEANIVNFDLD